MSIEIDFLLNSWGGGGNSIHFQAALPLAPFPSLFLEPIRQTSYENS